MRKKILLGVLVGLSCFTVGYYLVVSDMVCRAISSPVQKTVAAVPNRESPPVDISGEQVFSCSPETLYLGDVLTIKLPMPHSASLVVIDPDGEYFFLSQDEGTDTDADTSVPRPPIRQSDFQKMTEVKLSTDRASALFCDLKRGWVLKRIFSKSGRYVVKIGPAFDMCDPIADAWCKIHYVHRKRR